MRVNRENKLQSSIGLTRHYEFLTEQRRAGRQFFTQVSIIIPSDVATRRIVYLVTGYEVARASLLSPRYLGIANDIVAGLKESR